MARHSFTPVHDRGRVLVDVAVMIADGGEAIADIDVLRHQSGVLGPVASPPTVWRTLDEVTPGRLKKIAIARAYMRDAQVLILDEPTAALDARSEYEVFQRFKELSSGKTAVLISHRFSTVRMADRILVLADGKVEASGTHEELMAQGGRYAELFELQAQGYR